MFDSIGWGEIVVLGLAALFIFGPDRLPGLAKDAASGLKKAKAAITGVRTQLHDSLGDDFDHLRDLDIRKYHPKTFIRDQLLEDEAPTVRRGSRAGTATAVHRGGVVVEQLTAEECLGVVLAEVQVAQFGQVVAEGLVDLLAHAGDRRPDPLEPGRGLLRDVGQPLRTEDEERSQSEDDDLAPADRVEHRSPSLGGRARARPVSLGGSGGAEGDL